MKHKYNGTGCYRFIDANDNTIYVGCSKTIDDRIFKQHFKNGHLPSECYDSTLGIDIIKTKDYADALSLEQKLIDKYRPRYNKRDKSKNLFTNVYDLDDLDEPWVMYHSFDKNIKIRDLTTPLQNRLAILVTYVVFIYALVYMTIGGF